MLWYVVGAAAMIILPSIALTVGHIRRQEEGPTVVPEELALRLAKAVSKGTFEKAHFGTKPDVDLFPTKKTCPHCQNKDRKVWDSAKAVELLSDISKLAQGIRQRRFCRGCLDQLSEIAKERKKHLPALDEKKDPRTLPYKVRLWKFPAFSLMQLVVVLFLASLLAYNFAHEVMVGPAYLEGIFLWAGVVIVALLALWKLARKRPFALLVMGVVIVLMIKGCGLAG